MINEFGNDGKGATISNRILQLMYKYIFSSIFLY